jgi:hypothetical protein
MKTPRRKKGDLPGMQKVLLQLPQEIHHRLKILAVTERKTLSEVVSESLAEFLSKKEQQRR